MSLFAVHPRRLWLAFGMNFACTRLTSLRGDLVTTRILNELWKVRSPGVGESNIYLLVTGATTDTPTQWETASTVKARGSSKVFSCTTTPGVNL